MTKETRQTIAVVLGGCAVFYVTFMTFATLWRMHAELSFLVAGLIFWREFEFTDMRMELDKLRKQA